MADTTLETREEREARWWRDWWAADYSWDGLAKKEIVGGGQWGEKTLQDYWRRDPLSGKARTDAVLKKAGELVEFDGCWWHIAHVPRVGRNASPVAIKSDVYEKDWRILSNIVNERLANAKETPGGFPFLSKERSKIYNPNGIDSRARFDGVVAKSVLFSNRCFKDSSGSLNLSLCGGVFLDDFDCAALKFSHGTNFCGVLFCGYADFSQSNFIGSVNFADALFLGRAVFVSTSFECFAKFYRVVFVEFVTFYLSKFSKYISFDESVFLSNASFFNTMFDGGATFRKTQFLLGVKFERSKFSGNATFRGAIFSGAAEFDATRFGNVTIFSGVFKGDGSFRNVVFERQVTFSAQVDLPEKGFAGAFHGAQFADIADFSKSGPLRPGTTDRNDGARMAIAFAETLFEKTLILTDGSDQDAARAFRDGTMKAVRDTPEGQEREDLLDKLEAGCRTVKIAMGKARDEAQEQRYYRFQLQARQARGDTHWTEKAFGQLYGLVSDYGGSLGRPLGWWIGLAVLLGLVYWLWAGGMNGTLAGDLAGIAAAPFSGESWANPAAAMSFSAGRSLFLNAWLGVPEKDTTTWQWVFLHGYGPGWGLLVRLVSALQSILSGILLFLFALAVRRRFQIGG